MSPEEIERIGGQLFGGGIRPRRDRLLTREEGTEVFGFDTEYDSDTSELICWQLWHPESGGRLVEARKLRVDALHQACEQMLRRPVAKAVLLTWWSLAEIQHLDLKQCVSLRTYARGSLDVAWKAKRGELVEVYDLARWYDMTSLSRAAESIGEKKMKWRRDRVKRGDLRFRAFREYAIHDAKLARLIYDGLDSEFSEEGISILDVRTPAQASSRMFRSYIQKRIEPPDADVRKLAARATWGGRAEAFARGSWKDATEWDLKSAYPSAAVSIGVFPIASSWRAAKSVEELAERKGFGRVRFRFPTGTYAPCLPVEADGRNVWPLAGESWATGFEIKLALDMGAEMKLVEGFSYDRGTTSLSDYMQDCLARRKKAMGAGRQKWKLAANALIGKFAQRTQRTADDLEIAVAAEVPTDVFFSCSPEERIEIARLIGWNLGISTGPVWCPEWQGLVTGFVRAQLGGCIFPGALYCHTDSVWTRETIHYRRPPFDSSWEKKDSGRCTVARTRFGALGEHVAHHAVHSRETARGMLKEFARTGEDISLVYERRGPRKFRECLRAGDVSRVGKWESVELVADTRWCWKRRLLPSGETAAWRDIGEYLTARGK